MAIPLIAAVPAVAASLVGAITAAIVTALGTKMGSILAGAGLMFIAISGIQTVVGFIISDVNLLISSMGSAGSLAGAQHIGQVMMKMAAYAGLFDAINIVISGQLAILSVMTLRVVLGRFNAQS